MKKKSLRNFSVTGGLFLLFIVWKVVIQFVDVKAIGPHDSTVGLAGINGAFHEMTGVHMAIYNVTDWLGIIPIFIVLGFGIVGLVQLVKRKNLWKVDVDILMLGGFYVLVLAAFVLFEKLAINYRSVLIEGCLEASYPSSTTLMVMCVMPTTMMQCKERMKNQSVRKGMLYLMLAFTAFMVIGRMVSGVHWITDIIGGGLLSASLVMLYYSMTYRK